MGKRVTRAHTHTHALSFLFSLISDLLGSDLWHLHTSDLGGGGRTHAGSHTNKIKRGADRWREGRLKEVHSEMLESFGGSRGDAGTRRRGEGGRWGKRRGLRMIRAARAFTLGEA